MAGLYAVGECACVSVHGANRLGCNSLIDLVVFGRRVGLSVSDFAEENKLPSLPAQTEKEAANQIGELLDSSGTEHVPMIRDAMKKVMTNNCSVFRDRNGLVEALHEIRELKQRYTKLAHANKGRRFNYELQEALELGNMLKTAEVIAFSALNREESRGSHFRNDYPERNDKEWLKHTLVFSTAQGFELRYRPVVVTKFPPETRRY
jgi:succinate dehydrogenase / fumarate reductase flavoprotein subunit